MEGGKVRLNDECWKINASFKAEKVKSGLLEEMNKKQDCGAILGRMLKWFKMRTFWVLVCVDFMAKTNNNNQ